MIIIVTGQKLLQVTVCDTIRELFVIEQIGGLLRFLTRKNKGKMITPLILTQIIFERDFQGLSPNLRSRRIEV